MNKKVCVIGGGTGISTILKGLKNYTKNISAIVSMSDDGGGSGILRSEYKMLPPGDVRSCLVALSNTEPLMQTLLQYRFDKGSLEGQNVGNIIIAALNNIYGSFDKALYYMGNVFDITGRVIPVTLTDTHLVAELSTGDKIVGESIIPKMAYKLNGKIIKITMMPKIPKANKDAIKAIEDADTIIIGPGSLYTSIIPNLIIKGILDALKKSKAKKVYIANVMTQRGETLGMTLKDHILALEDHSYKGIFDIVLANNYRGEEKIFKNYYEYEESLPIFAKDEDKNFLKDRKIKLIEDNFVEIKNSFIRHNTKKIGRSLSDYL